MKHNNNLILKKWSRKNNTTYLAELYSLGNWESKPHFQKLKLLDFLGEFYFVPYFAPDI